MTHIPGNNISGSTGETEYKSEKGCRECGAPTAYYQIWDSSDGGWEDYKYHCKSCGARWRVDGIDS